jgi:hypothetical protein
MKVYEVVELQLHSFLTYRERRVVRFRLMLLYPGEKSPVPTGYEAEWPQTGLDDEVNKNVAFPCREPNSEPSTVQAIAQSFYRLSYSG